MSSHAAVTKALINSLTFEEKLNLYLFRISSTDRTNLFRKLIAGIDLGIPLSILMEGLRENFSDGGRNTPTGVALKIWHMGIQNGLNLGEAMSGTVPEYVSQVIRSSAAHTGEYVESMRSLLNTSDSQSKILGEITAALTYPMVLIFVTLAAYGFFAKFVVVRFTLIIPREDIYGMPNFVANLGEFIADYSLYLGSGFVFFVIVVLLSLKRWTGTLRSKFDAYLPPWNLYRIRYGASFLSSISILVENGIKMSDALEIQSGFYVTHPWMFERVSAAMHQMQSGHNLGEALWNTGHGFPDKDIIQDLRFYANMPNFEKNIKAIVENWLSGAVDLTRRNAGRLRAAGFLVTAWGISMLILSIFGLQQQATIAAQSGAL